VFDPKPEMFNIRDIAHALSMQPRFLGHLPIFYSVAQHSIQVADIVAKEHPELALEALLHDAAEAYIGDQASPIKKELPDYKALEATVEASIRLAFNLGPKNPIVKAADYQSYDWEVAHLRSGDPFVWQYEDDWKSVRTRFMNRYYDYNDLRTKAATITAKC